MRANIKVVEQGPDKLVIRDIGPHNKYMTVTNDAECVVDELVVRGILKSNQRLFYYDSDGQLDEIVVKDNRFTGFQTGPR